MFNKIIGEKKKIVGVLIGRLREKLTDTREQFIEAKQGAVEAPSRMQSRYDSAKEEFNYTAEMLEKIVLKLTDEILDLEKTEFKKKYEEVEIGSLIEVKSEKDLSYYFLLPGGAGEVINLQPEANNLPASTQRGEQLKSNKITIITSESPLGQKLIGKKEGKAIEVGKKTKKISKIF